MTDHPTLRRLLAALAVLTACLVLAACGDDEEDTGGGGGGETTAETTATQGRPIERNPENRGVTITIGSKNFTEQQVLGEIYAQGLEAAGYTVRTRLNLGDQDVALKALEGGQIDAYPEYTGTALTAFFDVPSEEIPDDPQEAFSQTRERFAERGLVALPPTPFTSSNEVGVTQDTAQEYDLRTISDLEPVADQLVLAGSPECRTRQDCLLGLQEVYGLEFKQFKPVDIGLRHQVLTDGEAEVSILFTTDPQIKREGFVLLEDDQNMFPPYNSTLVLREEVAEEAGPDLEEVVNRIQQGLTDEAMQELNARVDLDKESPQEVAEAYLRESGYVE